MILGLVSSGAAAAHGRWHLSEPVKTCSWSDGTVYKAGDYCYTSCVPASRCDIEFCSGDGTWTTIFACKQRDCRKVC
jgi:hypothetical protein